MCQHLESSITNRRSDFQKTNAIHQACALLVKRNQLFDFMLESPGRAVFQKERVLWGFTWTSNRKGDDPSTGAWTQLGWVPPAGRQVPGLPSGELLSMQVASRSEPRTSKEDHFEWRSNVNLRKVLEIVFFNQNTNTFMSSDFVMLSLIFFKNSKTVVSKHIQEMLKI